MPYFEVKNQDGNIVKSDDLLGKGRKVVLYAYPKDSTPGCTAEACNFRSKHELPFTLLADTQTTLLQALGAWGEKKFCGKTCVGTLRKTFVFSSEGVFERIIDKVDTKNAAAQLLG